MAGNSAPGLTGTGDEVVPQPIGVQPGYRAPVTAPSGSSYPVVGGQPFGDLGGAIYPVEPRYFEGEEFYVATLSVEELMDLQRRLDAAGMYTQDFTLGVPDPATFAAYKRLLGMANAAGTDELTMLARATEQYRLHPPAGPKRAPNIVRLSNPEDIKELANNLARDLYGGKLPDDTVNAIVGAVQSQERAASESYYAMGETGGTLVEPASTEVVAKNIIKERYPNEVAATQFGNAFDSIVSTLTTNRAGIR